MPKFASLGKFFGRTVQDTASVAAGLAVGETLHPILQPLVNESWTLNPARPPGAETLAAGVAQGQVDEGAALHWAEQQGIGGAAFRALVAIANVGPGAGPAFELWRRGAIDEGGFRRALKRLGLEDEWVAGLEQLRTVRLSPADVANAVQQGHMPNPGVLPDPDLSGPPFDVPLTQIDLDPIGEAAAHGVDLARLQVEANLAGLPPPQAELLAMLNRGYISEQAAAAGIREGHTKTKWTGPVLAMRNAVLTAQEYASARLRTWVTPEESYAGGALTGHSKEQMDLLFLNRGRPATPRQLWLGWARKVNGPRGVLTDYEDHAKAIAISDIRPEYAELLWNIRYNYPPLFQLNRLVTAGAVDAETAAKWASYNLEAPEVIAALTKYWKAGGSGAAREATAADLLTLFDGLEQTRSETLTALEQLGFQPDQAATKLSVLDARRVRSARDAAIGGVHRKYVKAEANDAAAAAALEQLEVPVTVANRIMAAWRVERDVSLYGLTAEQIRLGFRGGSIDRATALRLLEEKGNTPEQAAAFLDVPA